METTINQRVAQVVFEHLKLKNPAAFDKLLGVSRNTTYNIIYGIGDRLYKPSIEFIQKVCKAVPDLDANWLILGVGEVTKPDGKKVQKEIDRLSNLVVEVQTIKQENQSLKFALSLAANSANFQGSGNFPVVNKKSPVNQRFILIKGFVVNSLVNKSKSSAYKRTDFQ